MSRHCPPNVRAIAIAALLAVAGAQAAPFEDRYGEAEKYHVAGIALTFPPGTTSRWIGVPVFHDAESEPTEQWNQRPW